MRNWVVGCYIREYEQNGADRAWYGDRLLMSLSEKLTETGMEGMAARSLRLYRQFYLTYPLDSADGVCQIRNRNHNRNCGDSVPCKSEVRPFSFDHENERTVPTESYTGIFISTQSVWNLCEVIDAFEFSFEELRREAIENLDLKHDAFGRKIIAEFS